MRRKFGLYVMTDEDKTSDSNSSVVPSTTTPNLTMSMGFSEDIFGGSKS